MNIDELLNSARGIEDRVRSEMADIAHVEFSNETEARAALSLISSKKKVLRQARQELVQKEREAQQIFREISQESAVKASTGFWSIFMGRAARGRARADAKRGVAKQKDFVLNYLKNMKLNFDDVALQLSSAEEYVNQHIRDGEY